MIYGQSAELKCAFWLWTEMGDWKLIVEECGTSVRFQNGLLCVWRRKERFIYGDKATSNLNLLKASFLPLLRFLIAVFLLPRLSLAP